MFREETLFSREVRDEIKIPIKTRVRLIIFRKMFQRSVSTFSRMFRSHVGVSDHSATLSVPRCQAIDLYTGALTDLRCITTKCKCKSSLFPSLPFFLSFSRLSRCVRERSRNKNEKKRQEESNSVERKPQAVTCMSSLVTRKPRVLCASDSSECHISSADKNDYSSLE